MNIIDLFYIAVGAAMLTLIVFWAGYITFYVVIKAFKTIQKKTDL